MIKYKKLTKRQFIDFLKEKGVYERWKHNIFKVRKANPTKFAKKIIFTPEHNSINFLSASFFWMYTKEGDTFWRKLNVEWVDKHIINDK